MSFTKDLNTSVKGLRVGILRRFVEHDVPATPELLRRAR